MSHIKKYWGLYLTIVILLILIGIQTKWFGNKTTLFRTGGSVPGGGFSSRSISPVTPSTPIMNTNNFPVNPIGRVTCVDNNGNIIHRFGACRQEGGNPCANIGNGICID